MGILDFFRQQAGGTEPQTLIGEKVARSVIQNAGDPGPRGARRLAVSAAVLPAVAERIDRPSAYFEPFFRAFWSVLAAETARFGSTEELFDLVEEATPPIHLGIGATAPADHLRFGRQLAVFVDPSLDTALASVSARLALELGHEIVAAAKLMNDLPAPRGE